MVVDFADEDMQCQTSIKAWKPKLLRCKMAILAKRGGVNYYLYKPTACHTGLSVTKKLSEVVNRVCERETHILSPTAVRWLYNISTKLLWPGV